ncbi:sulfurtransferase-like selenium metabolism protein YedF [Limisalsivibrio acetivorans]|uniref:sulfurtransferase-like selenium metabolism protein YedF n=1 Tax=Limisalsivibrio acetivorans TaxID=1304888 RepID=UPI0003B54257|nr:sulfurtransferase-like selenium metabolism protein YedF [Limisalsivibrio acetivorans]
MKVDARGKLCPEPVIMAKEALESIEEGVVTVIVDNSTSSVNVKNFAESQGFTCKNVQEGDNWRVEIVKGYECSIDEVLTESSESIVLHISGECLGAEDETLGRKLMKGFLGNVKNMDSIPETLILVNTSVRMAVSDEDTVAVLKELEDMGVEVLCCGTCLEHFGIADNLRAGKIADAHTVMTKMFKADKLIRI